MLSSETYAPLQARINLNQTGLIKLILALIILGYAGLYFTTSQWVLLALASGLALAMVYQLGNIQMHDAKHQLTASGGICADGGTFSHKQQREKLAKNTRAVVHDGGSFERS